MTSIRTITFILLSTLFASAQGVDNLWLLGYDCCSPSLWSPMTLDFNAGSPILSTDSLRKIYFASNSSAISDTTGNLLFCTNGIFVADASGDTMMNGTNLNPSFYTTSHRQYGLRVPQASLILPKPGSSSIYYLIHNTIDDANTYCSLHLYYSIIDMSLNNGLGAVVSKNVHLINDSLVPGKITACKHANGRDWWIIIYQFHSPHLYEFLLTPSGISGPTIINSITRRDITVGQTRFSQDGTKMACYDPVDGLDIWNFERCSGIFSNQVHITINDSANIGGVEFSRSGRFLYVSSSTYLYQFDLNSSNIPNSKITIGAYDGHITGFTHATFFSAGMAKDNKIYLCTGEPTTVMHYITYPDSLGLACGFCQHCFALPAYNQALSNYPNYFLGADGSTICDSLPTMVNSLFPDKQLSLFPNPARDILYLNVTGKVLETAIFTTTGVEIQLPYTKISDKYLSFNVSHLMGGVYLLKVKLDDRIEVLKFIKE